MAHGNLIINQLANFDDLNKDELQQFAVYIMKNFVQAAKKEFDDRLIFYFLVLSARIGAYYDEKLNAKETRFIKDVLGVVYHDDKHDLIQGLKEPLKEIDEQCILLIMQKTPDAAMPFLHLILCFAYSDSVIEDDLIDFLEEHFGTLLMLDFFNSGEESVPHAGPLLEGLEADIVKWLAKDDDMKTDKDLYAHFGKYTKKDLNAALKSLKQKNVVYSTDTYVGNVLGLTGEPYRFSRKNKKSKTASKPSVKKTAGTSKKSDALTQKVDVEKTFTVYLPENMDYVAEKTPKGTVGRVLTAFTDDGDIHDEEDVQHPFDFRRNITFTYPNKEKYNLKNTTVVNRLITHYKDFAHSMLGARIYTVKKDNLIILYCRSGDHSMQIFLITKNGVFSGQYFVNDVSDSAQITKIVKEFIDKIEAYSAPKKSNSQKQSKEEKTLAEKKRQETARKAIKYRNACELMKGDKEEDFDEAVNKFTQLGDYKDAAAKIEEAKAAKEAFLKKQEELRQKGIYDQAYRLLSSSDLSDIDKAVELTRQIPDYPGTGELVDQAAVRKEELLEEIRKQEEEKKMRQKAAYRAGCELLSKDDLTKSDIHEAIVYFNMAEGYGKAAEIIQECNRILSDMNIYEAAVLSMASSDPDEIRRTISEFEKIREFKDSEEKIQELEKKLAEVEAELERKRLEEEQKQKKAKRRKRLLWIPVIALILGAGWGLFYRYMRNFYDNGVAYLEEGKYVEAVNELEHAVLFTDAPDLINAAKVRYLRENISGNRREEYFYEYYEDLVEAGYEIPEDIVKAATQYTGTVYFNSNKNTTSHSKTINLDMSIAYLHYDCWNGYSDKELPVVIVLYKNEEEIMRFDGLTIQDSQKYYIELDNATLNQIGIGTVTAIMSDLEGNDICKGSVYFKG